MTGALRKPKARLFRSFLYLDGDEVINSLSGLEGGAIDEILTTEGEEGSGDVGAQLGVTGAKAGASKKRSRKFEEEVRRKRTEHSAATLLLSKLHDEEAIGIVEGNYGAAVYNELEEHMLLEFKAQIRIHPLHQVVSAARSWLDVAPGFGVEKSEMKEARDFVKLLESMASPKSGESTFLVFAETGENVDHRLVLAIQERYLLVPLDAFSGTATFVAQVDRILPDDDELLAVRLLRNAPQLALEREGLAEAMPDLIGGIDELGIQVSRDDFFLRAPAVVLRPICIYK